MITHTENVLLICQHIVQKLACDHPWTYAQHMSKGTLPWQATQAPCMGILRRRTALLNGCIA